MEIPLGPLLEALRLFTPSGILTVLILALGGVIAAGAYTLHRGPPARQLPPTGIPSDAQESSPPVNEFAGLLSRVGDAISSGEHRQAVIALYRGLEEGLERRFHLAPSPGSTPRERLRELLKLQTAGSPFTEELIQLEAVYEGAAYSPRSPSREVVEGMMKRASRMYPQLSSQQPRLARVET